MDNLEGLDDFFKLSRPDAVGLKSVPTHTDDWAKAQLANTSWQHPDSNDPTEMRAIGKQELNLHKIQKEMKAMWEGEEIGGQTNDSALLVE